MKTISMGRRLALALSLAMTLVVVLVTIGFYLSTAADVERNFTDKVDRTLSYLEGTLGSLLWNFDHETAAWVADTVLRDDVVVGVAVLDEKGNHVVSLREQTSDDVLVRTRPIRFQNTTVGTLEIHFSQASLADVLVSILWESLTVWLLAVLSITMLTTFFVRKFFRGPLKSFSELAKSYRETPELPPEEITRVLEFQPIEAVVRDLANDVLRQFRDLQASEAYYRSIFETALFGVAITGPDFLFKDVNDAWCEFIGYSREELLGKKGVADVTLPEDGPDSIAMFEKMIDGVIDHSILEKRYLTKSGDVIHSMSFIKGIFDDQDQYQGSVATILDVTEIKRAERALKESEEKYRRIFESVEDGYILADMDGTILSVNPATARMLNYDHPDQLIGKDIAHDVYADAQKRSELKEALTAKGRVKGYLLDLRRRDGGVLSVEGNVRLVFDEDNSPVAIEGTIRDVTERNRVAEELRQYREHLEVLVAERTAELNAANEQLKKNFDELSENRTKYYDLYENSPECLMSVDVTTGRIVECNSRVPETIGVPREEVIGRNLLEMYDVVCRERAVSAFEKLRKDGEVHGVELKVLRANGPSIDVLLDAAGFYDAAGRLMFTRSSWTNISQRVQIEKDLQEANQHLQELDQMKSMFIASVSHELRTPLNSIIGFSGMLLAGMSGDLNDEQRDSLNRVNRSGKHLLSLISDVIDISKIEAGRIERSLDDFSLEELVKDALENIQPTLLDRDLELKVDAPNWPRLRTDRKRLLQCLLNYLSNAAKYIEEGSITVRVRENGDWVVISVEDTGIGIAEQDLPRLFEAFERLESGLRVKAGGTGLGLYLVKKIATGVLGGDVSVESRLGKGSVFSLRIPKVIDALEPRHAEDMEAL